MNISKNLLTLNPKKFASNLRESIQLHYKGREEVRIWGINILENNEKSDGVLIKFLESEIFNLDSSMNKIISTVKWREEIEIEELISRKSGSGFWVSGVDYQDQPVCYVELSKWCDSKSPLLSIFGCWVQLLEKVVRSFNFSEIGGVSTVFRVVDVTGTSKAQKKCLFDAFQITNQYYPDIVNHELYIGGFFDIPRSIRKRSPCVHRLIAHQQLYKYVPVVHVPVQYGGIPPIDRNVQDESYETIARNIDISPSSRHDVVFYCYKGTREITLRVKVIAWCDVSYGINFFGESTQKSCWTLKRMNTGKYEEFKIKNLEEDGILFLSVYNSGSISKSKLVYLLSSFPQGSLVEIKIEKRKGKGKEKEWLNNIQGVQKKANEIYHRVNVLIPTKEMM